MKGPRETIRPKENPGNKEARPESFHGARGRVLTRLSELDEIEKSYATRKGLQPPDYSRARKRIEALKPDAPARVVFEALFDAGIAPFIAQNMATDSGIKNEEGKPFAIVESEIKERFFGVSLIPESKLDNKKGGDVWLSEYIEERTKNFHLDIAHRVQTLACAASDNYGREAGVATRLLFMCGSNEIDPTTSVHKLERLVSAREHEAAAHGVSLEGNFFEKMRNFISVYSDITHTVLQSMPQGDARKRVSAKARNVLSQVLQASEFETVYWKKQDGPPDPFGLFQKKLFDKALENPWVTSDCAKTPFDIDMFARLITRDAPRGLIAEAAVGLNNYDNEVIALRARHADESGRALKNIVGDIARVKEKPEGEDKGKEKRQELGRLYEAVAHHATSTIALISDYVTKYPAKSQVYPGLVQKIEELDLDKKAMLFSEAVYEDPHIQEMRTALRNVTKEMRLLTKWRSPAQLKEANDVHPMTALLRLVSAKKLIAQKPIQHDFHLFFKELGVPESPSQVALLASSVRDVLATEDPHLHIPLLGTADTRSLREIVTDYANDTFDRDVIRRGPYIQLERPIAPEQPLYMPAYLAEYYKDPERLAAAQSHLDPAAGTDPVFVNKMLLAAAEKWREQEGSYEEIKRFAAAQAHEYWDLDANYSVAFYRSAGSAVADLTSKLIHIPAGARVLITNQEYSTITEEYVRRGARITRDEVLYLSDPASKRAYNGAQMFDQFQARVREGAAPFLFAPSFKTRFGDALCGGDEGEIKRFLSLLRETHPGMLLGPDLCQSFGRNDTAEKLASLGVDYAFNSGSKVGVENVAALVLRTKYPKNKPSWMSALDEETRRNPMRVLQPGSATDSSVPIAALGMLMRDLNGRVNYWSLDAVPEGSNMREVSAETYERLTERMVKKADEYLGELFTAPGDPTFPVDVPGDALSSRSAYELFGMRIMYPGHRNKDGYNGIVTVSIPHIVHRFTTEVRHKNQISEKKHEQASGVYVAERLAARNMPVLPVLKNQNSIRVSYRMLHNFAGVDAFFKALREIHIEYLRNITERGEYKTFADLCAGMPRAKDDGEEY